MAKRPETAKQMFDVFPIVQQLHEMLWYLTEALTLEAATLIHNELRSALEKTEQLTHLSPEAIAELDLPAHRSDINLLLLRTSELVRAGYPRNKEGLRNAKSLSAEEPT